MRTFFGIAIEDKLQQSAKRLVKDAKLHQHMKKIRWIPSPNWHLTLRFLGNTSEEQLEQLEKLVSELADNVAPFTMESNGVLMLPPHHPRVFSLSIRLNDSIATLAKGLNDIAKQCDFEPDKRLLLPHITLGRWKYGLQHPPKILLKDFDEQSVTQFHLYQSEPHEGGSVYTPIKTFELNPELAVI